MAVFVKPERIVLKLHPEYNERWLEDRIAENHYDIRIRRPGPQGQAAHPAARWPIRFAAARSRKQRRRYEVEVQLGPTDEAHIIRTIEYWDIERKRYPQYEHCAVLVVEDITSRFLNVVSLFNGTLPLIAIQMHAHRIGEHLTLIFTTVMDELTRGLIDEDEDAAAAPTDRAYWEQKGTKATVSIADDLLDMAKSLDPALELKYNKFYIGLARNGQPFNFITFTPQEKKQPSFRTQDRAFGRLETSMKSDGLDFLGYDNQWHRYQIRLNKQDICRNTRTFSKL